MKIQHDIRTLKSPNQCLSWYMVHSYLYYILDRPVIPDSEYDQLCRWLLDAWDSVTHPHKALVSVEDLRAGTGYALATRYPKIVESTAQGILRDMAPRKKLAKKVAVSKSKAKLAPDTTFATYDSLFG